MPSGRSGGNVQSPYGQQNYPTGPGQGQFGQPFPQGGMDPQYFQLWAQQQMLGQQQQYGQRNIADAIERAKGLMGNMGIPSEGGLGGLETWAQQKSALESEPIRKNKQEAMRGIEDQWARKGSALGSESERNRAEMEGASLAAMRSSSIGAAIDAFMKRPQMRAQLIASMRQ